MKRFLASDICRCMNKECIKKDECRRSVEAFKGPSRILSYCNFKPDENGECLFFISVRDE